MERNNQGMGNIEDHLLFIESFAIVISKIFKEFTQLCRTHIAKAQEARPQINEMQQQLIQEKKKRIELEEMVKNTLNSTDSGREALNDQQVRPKNAYTLFVADQRGHMMTQHPDMTFHKMNCLLSIKWKHLSQENRQVYERKFQEITRLREEENLARAKGREPVVKQEEEDQMEPVQQRTFNSSEKPQIVDESPEQQPEIAPVGQEGTLPLNHAEANELTQRMEPAEQQARLEEGEQPEEEKKGNEEKVAQEQALKGASENDPISLGTLQPGQNPDEPSLEQPAPQESLPEEEQQIQPVEEQNVPAVEPMEEEKPKLPEMDPSVQIIEKEEAVNAQSLPLGSLD